jgi:hypothetical protein
MQQPMQQQPFAMQQSPQLPQGPVFGAPQGMPQNMPQDMFHFPQQGPLQQNPYQQQGPMPALQSAFTQPPVAQGGIGSLNQSQHPSSLSQTSPSNQGSSQAATPSIAPANNQQARIVGGNGVM